MRRSTSWSWTLSTSERQVRGRSADLPSTPDDEPLVVPLSRFKTGLAFAGSVGFVLLGVWLTGFEAPRAVLAGWLAIVVFGLFGAIGFVRLVAGGFAVRADARGIEDLSSPVGAGLVPWEEIEQVRTLEYQGQRYAGVFTKDPEVVLRRQRNPLKRAAMRFNVRRAGTAVLIPGRRAGSDR